MKGRGNMKNKRWIISLILVLALMLTLVACTPGSNQSGNTQENQLTEEQSPDPNMNEDEDDQSTDDENNTGDNTSQGENAISANVSYEDIKLTPEEAFNNYMQEYPEAKVQKLQLDLDDGSYYYKIEGYDNENEYELKINPLDGTMIKEERDDRDDDDGEITVDHVRKIDELLEKALEEAGSDYEVEEWNLEWEDNKIVFEIELISDADEIEYKYDVNTGELIEKDL